MTRKLCPHNKIRYHCSDCQGSGLCEHNKRKYYCVECKGSGICEHNKRKEQCKDCKGSLICEHNRRKVGCKDCKGTAICIHDNIKYKCKECKGSNVCNHGNLKYHCKDCDGTGVCEHNKLKYNCIECKGSGICEHNKIKKYCNQCKGRGLCPNCIDWPDYHIGKSKYDGYCSRCFVQLFPKDPRTKIRNIKTKEEMVKKAILNAAKTDDDFKGFIHNRPIYTADCDCTHRRRIDHRKLVGNTIIAVETDEFAHRNYDNDDEEVRYDDLYMVHSGKWIFIRFNPDKTKKYKSPIEERIPKLLKFIKKMISNALNDKYEDLVTIWQLYYE